MERRSGYRSFFLSACQPKDRAVDESRHITDCPVGSVAPFLISCADLTLTEGRPPKLVDIVPVLNGSGLAAILLLLAIRRVDLCSAGFVGPLSYSSDGKLVSLVWIKERKPVLQGSPKETKALPVRRRHSKKQLPMGGSPIDESLESETKEKKKKNY